MWRWRVMQSLLHGIESARAQRYTYISFCFCGSILLEFLVKKLHGKNVKMKNVATHFATSDWSCNGLIRSDLLKGMSWARELGKKEIVGKISRLRLVGKWIWLPTVSSFSPKYMALEAAIISWVLCIKSALSCRLLRDRSRSTGSRTFMLASQVSLAAPQNSLLCCESVPSRMLAAKRETVEASSGDAWSKRVEGILRPPSGTTSFDCCKLFQLAVLLVAFTSAKLPTRVSCTIKTHTDMKVFLHLK